MSLTSLTNVGNGGIGLNDRIPASLVELQGLTLSVLAGAPANTTIALAAIRQEDTLVGALNNNAGTITDIKANITINSCQAAATVTCASVAAADTVTVGGVVFTAIANGSTPSSYKQFSVGASDNACATNLAAAINAQQKSPAVNRTVTAVAATNVVTITADAEGTGGNAITLVTSNGTRLAATGSGNLAGGTATGGIKSSSTTNQVLLFWLNKR